MLWFIYERMSNVYELAKLVERNKIKGSFVECGVWREGCVAIMAVIAHRAGNNRKTWLFDSFEGLPEPQEIDGESAREYASGRVSGDLFSINKCVASLEDVKDLFFNILKLDEDNIVIKKGWFQDTLQECKDKLGPIAILRLDADWYESTKLCLESLYDNIINGGYIIIDDYGSWEGCKKATDEFLKERKLHVKLKNIDNAGYYFQKPNN